MPKKLATNSKAVEARERKETVKKTKRAEEAQKQEDAKWSDVGSTAAEKRAQEKEAQRAEEARKKEAKRLLLLKEEAEMKAVKQVKVNPYQQQKLTQFQMAQARRAEEEAEQKRRQKEAESASSRLSSPPELEENLNRQEASAVDARNLDQALNDLALHQDIMIASSSLPSSSSSSTLSSSAAADLAALEAARKFNLKAAYREYEEKNYPLLKNENPTLKFSQLKQMLFENFQKDPDHPWNKLAAIEKRIAANQEK